MSRIQSILLTEEKRQWTELTEGVRHDQNIIAQNMTDWTLELLFIFLAVSDWSFQYASDTVGLAVKQCTMTLVAVTFQVVL